MQGNIIKTRLMLFVLVIARMDTPQYGETLKFVYTKYQPI